MKIRCPNCQTIQFAPAQFCKGCGVKLESVCESVPKVVETTEIGRGLKIISGVVVLGIIFLFIFKFTFGNKERKEQTSNNQTALTTVSTPNQNNDFHRQSLSIVGADDGWQLPDDNDLRVKRAEFLLRDISGKTKESPFDIAYATDTMSNFLEQKFGKKIKRLQLLEEMQDIYSNGRAEKYGKKYSDVLGIYALAKYGN